MKLSFVASLAFATFVAVPAAHAADPSVGDCLSATETSLHLRSSHKLREARAQLLICSAATCPAEVREECMHRISDLNADEPTVVFAVKTTAGLELSDVKVTMDGEVVAERLDGSALSLDPGSHSFTFEAAGVPPVTKMYILHEGEKGREETVVVEPPVVTAAKGNGKEQRLLGIALGTAGLAGLVVGGIFGGLASSAWSSAKAQCQTYPSGCSAAAIAEDKTAWTFANIATAGAIAGGVLLAGGVTIYLAAPKDKLHSIGLQMTPSGFVVAGTF